MAWTRQQLVDRMRNPTPITTFLAQAGINGDYVSERGWDGDGYYELLEGMPLDSAKWRPWPDGFDYAEFERIVKLVRPDLYYTEGSGQKVRADQ